MAIKSSGIGSFCLARNRKPGGGFYPNWLVQFRLPDGIRERESSKLPICAKCLVDEDALKARARCACIEEVKAWAAVRLEELVIEWKAGRLNAQEDVRAPVVKALTLGEVGAVYLVRGPEDRVECLRALHRVVLSARGLMMEECFVKDAVTRELSVNAAAAVWAVRLDELVPDMWDEFAWSYQEYERKGWTKRGEVEVPADAWVQIKKARPAHPDPDRTSATCANTTIISQMRKAKAVLGPESRDSYLKPLRERFPDGLRKWWETKVKVRTPDGRFSLSREVYEKMWKGLPALKVDDPQVWGLLRLHWTTGMRPCEAAAARLSWLEVDAEGVVMLVVRNRPEEGFTMKDSTTRQERPWPLPADLLELLPRISSAGHLLGCETPHAWEMVYRRASAWLREMGVEGTQTLYNLRKLVATVKVANEGLEKAQVALGHAPGSTVTMGSYAGTSGEIRALSDADLSPERVMGGRRVAWVMPSKTPPCALE